MLLAPLSLSFSGNLKVPTRGDLAVILRCSIQSRSSPRRWSGPEKGVKMRDLLLLRGTTAFYRVVVSGGPRTKFVEKKKSQNQTPLSTREHNESFYFGESGLGRGSLNEWGTPRTHFQKCASNFGSFRRLKRN